MRPPREAPWPAAAQSPSPDPNRTPEPPASASLRRRLAELQRLRAEAENRTDRALDALFLESFGDPNTNPMGWSEERLGDLCDVVTGVPPPGNLRNDGSGICQWVGSADLEASGTWILDRARRSLTKDGLESLPPRRRLPEGSVLLSARGRIGLVSIAGSAAATDLDVYGVARREDIDPWYLFAWFRQRRQRLKALGRPGPVPRFPVEVVKALRLAVPPPDRQRGFRKVAERLHAARLRARSIDEPLESVRRHLSPAAIPVLRGGPLREPLGPRKSLSINHRRNRSWSQ